MYYHSAPSKPLIGQSHAVFLLRLVTRMRISVKNVDVMACGLIHNEDILSLWFQIAV
jgi:hypothetical protein